MSLLQLYLPHSQQIKQVCVMMVCDILLVSVLYGHLLAIEHFMSNYK